MICDLQEAEGLSCGKGIGVIFSCSRGDELGPVRRESGELILLHYKEELL